MAVLGRDGGNPQRVVPVGVYTLEVVDGIGHHETVDVEIQAAAVIGIHDLLGGGLDGLLWMLHRHADLLAGLQLLQLPLHGIQQLLLLPELRLQLLNAFCVGGGAGGQRQACSRHSDGQDKAFLQHGGFPGSLWLSPFGLT